MRKKSLTSIYLIINEDISMYKNLVLVLILLLLSACGLFGSYYEPEPVGVGKASDELKLSPCACLQVELPKNLPDWFIETI